MTFSDDIKRHQRKRDARFRRIFIGTTEEVERSVVDGSTLTGAPGVPVQLSHLRGSYINNAGFLSPSLWRIVSNVEYADFIEAGGYIVRSSKPGVGPHSIAKTRTGWGRIVDHVAKREANR